MAHVPAATGPLDLEVLDAWRQFTTPFVEAFPDLRLTVEDIFSVGDMVAARIAFHGTHRGEFQGVPPTGKEVAFSSMVFNHIVDGRVEENWVAIDLLRLMGQLGATLLRTHPGRHNPYDHPESTACRKNAQYALPYR